MNFNEQLTNHINLSLLCIEGFFAVGEKQKDKINPVYYSLASKLCEELSSLDAFLEELSTEISSCDTPNTAKGLPELEKILNRALIFRGICEQLLTDCEAALADKRAAARRIHALADVAIRKIKLL